MRQLPSKWVAAVATLFAVFAGQASAQPAGDGLVVPNARAGLARLGMTSTEVLSVLGRPTQSGFLGSGEGYIDYKDGSGNQTVSLVTWGPKLEVFQINIHPAAAGYATKEGVTFGMSELDVRLRMGQPKQRLYDEVESSWYVHYPGLMLLVQPTRGVVNIGLCLPRYQRKHRPGRRWCY